MELRHIRYFVVAAEEAHFGRAAQRLRISRPGLGLQIRELEEELRVKLFERLPRGLRLTAAGAVFLADARRVLGDIGAAIEHAQDAGHGKVGVLRVGHIPMTLLRSTWIGNIMPAFCARYRNVEVRTIDLNMAEQCAALEEGRIDVGIVYAPPEHTCGLRNEMLDETLIDGALIPAAHPLARKNPLHCRDLRVLPLLQPPAATNPSGHDWVLRVLRARGLEVQPSGHQITDPSLRVSFVAAGAGWMPASSATVEMLLPGTRGVVFRKWTDAPIPYPSSVIWRPTERSPLVGNFLSVCRELRDGRTSALPNQLGVA